MADPLPMGLHYGNSSNRSKFWALHARLSSQEPQKAKLKTEEQYSAIKHTSEVEAEALAMLDQYRYGAYHYAGCLPLSRLGSGDGGDNQCILQSNNLWRRSELAKQKDMPSFRAWERCSMDQ